MNLNRAFVSVVSNISPTWFRLPVWVRYPVIVILSLLLGWLCFGYLGELLSDYLSVYFSREASLQAFSFIGFLVFLSYFYHANIIMRYQLELNEKTFRDGMTGLYNRRYLRSKRKYVTKLVMENKLYATAYFVDMNYFGEINKKYQHRTGDLAIKTVAKVISSVFRRQSDIGCAMVVMSF